MMEQEIKDLTRRVVELEVGQRAQADALHRIEVGIAQLTGAVKILQWGLPVAVTIGGGVIGAIVAIMRAGQATG